MAQIDRIWQWSAGLWLKSSRSYGSGECVEVRARDGGIQVRDSKDPDGPRLAFSRREWAAFVAGVRAGEFDQFC
ncbi:DUF397 domain-containing protein [Actinoplanes sp. NPDC049265]|uniref:DUF397 domain-containing protein n=1 Tax=Actinoplanes sp. NPDC049265 TaxID=3363902 RepID=UPI0037102294